jgi:DNA-binding LacI/PurR family transcriptional regulator
LEAYQQVIAAHHLDDDADLVQHCGPRPDHACEAARRLLALRPRPTAIIAINDYLAIPVAKTVVGAGLRIPEGISVAGFDDIPLSQYLMPALTTVRANAEALGEKAVELMLARMADTDMPPQHIVLPTSLIIRESTGVVSS